MKHSCITTDVCSSSGSGDSGPPPSCRSGGIRQTEGTITPRILIDSKAKVLLTKDLFLLLDLKTFQQRASFSLAFCSGSRPIAKAQRKRRSLLESLQLDPLRFVDLPPALERKCLVSTIVLRTFCGQNFMLLTHITHAGICLHLPCVQHKGKNTHSFSINLALTYPYQI